MGDEKECDGLHVLCVDDHTDTLFVMSRVLQRAGHRVVTAAGCEAARRAATDAAEPFDVLVTEVTLHDGDGLTLLGDLRALHPDIRGVVLSAEADASRSRRAGFARHVVKPATFAEVEAALCEAVEADRATTTTTGRPTGRGDFTAVLDGFVVTCEAPREAVRSGDPFYTVRRADGTPLQSGLRWPQVEEVIRLERQRTRPVRPQRPHPSEPK